ncbi:hypothetical protein WJX73_003745 [Symbiochloris irregularis]|uniref:Uncharacterized protein n=1 Tax=Symbiochloris irregularis TaxID=706552 RepID=A0AAW1NWY3_9CHLO
MTHRWMGGDWLRNRADSERDVPLDDSSLLCPHGALVPTSIPGPAALHAWCTSLPTWLPRRMRGRRGRELRGVPPPQEAAVAAVYLTPWTDYCLIPEPGCRVTFLGQRVGEPRAARVRASAQRLEFPPPFVSKKRGRWAPEEGGADVWQIRQMGDWRQLASLYEHTTSPHKP